MIDSVRSIFQNNMHIPLVYITTIAEIIFAIVIPVLIWAIFNKIVETERYKSFLDKIEERDNLDIEAHIKKLDDWDQRIAD